MRLSRLFHDSTLGALVHAAVIDAADTRRVLIDVLRQLDTKRELGRPRPHANTPL